MGIIPDKFILLKCKQTASISRLKNNLLGINQQLFGPDLEELAANCLKEHELNLKGVREAFNQFIFEHDVADKSYNDVIPGLNRMLSIRFRENAPRRPPRIIIVGPPGSGRNTQSIAIAKTFGLVHVSARALLKNEIKFNPDVGRVISQCIDSGELIPDNIINPLIEKRLKQSDCKVNGWIMEGFPYSRSQVNLLKALRIKPGMVVVFECDEETCVRHRVNVRVDPQTGVEYNILDNPPQDETTNSRLIELNENSEDNIRKLFKQWKSQIITIEENYRDKLLHVQADREVDLMTEYLADEIDNTFQGRM